MSSTAVDGPASSLQGLADQASDPRLKTLLGYLSADPANSVLRQEAAEQALGAKEPMVALALLDGSLGDEPSLLHLRGVALMNIGHFGEAVPLFETLLVEQPENPAIAFNLAWSLAMLGDKDRSLQLLTDEVIEEEGSAAMLKVELLHERGEFEEALALGRQSLEAHPEHRGLAAAVSVLALDLDDEALAERCAAIAGDHPSALVTSGTLALGRQDVASAMASFETALAANERQPRAWVGRGLGHLLGSAPEAAAADLDRGAELFEDHLGSWIAAGWAYLLAGRSDLARARFEHALALDPTFAESHGSLAVIAASEGRLEEAAASAEVALRLDRQCFSAQFARVLLQAAGGQEEEAKALLERLLQAPLDGSGRTVASAIAGIAVSRPS